MHSCIAIILVLKPLYNSIIVENRLESQEELPISEAGSTAVDSNLFSAQSAI